MLFKKYIPKFPLSLYIQHIIYAEGGQELPYLMELPEGKVNLVIELNDQTKNTLYTENNFGGIHTMKNAWFSGTQSQKIIYECDNNALIMSIRFTTGGFFSLTKIPVTEIIYPGLETELILGSRFRQFYQQLINEKSIAAKFKMVEQFFMAFFTGKKTEITMADFIDKNMDKPIDWLAHKSGYTQKHLIHTIKKQTGFTPKYLQRLHRFQKIVGYLQKEHEKISWSSVAYENNYFDQAHFIKEFVHFTGLSPVKYFSLNDLSKHNKTFTDVRLLSDYPKR